MRTEVTQPFRWTLLAAIALVAAVMLGASPLAQRAGAQGPYGGAGLPPGILEMSIGGQPLDLTEFPVINTNQPVISGRVNQTSGTVTILVESTPQTFTANIGPDGRFSAQVPQPLDPGQHKVYVNGQLVGQFTVQGSTSPSPTTAPPGPPSTGAGRASAADNLTWLWVMLAVMTGLGVGTAAVWSRKRA